MNVSSVALEQKMFLKSEMAQGDKFTKRARPAIVYGGLIFIFIVYVLVPVISYISGTSSGEMPQIKLPPMNRTMAMNVCMSHTMYGDKNLTTLAVNWHTSTVYSNSASKISAALGNFLEI